MPTQFGQLQPVCIHHTARPSLIHLAQVLGGRVDWFQSVLEQTLQVYFIDYPLSDNVERLHGENARSLQVSTCSYRITMNELEFSSRGISEPKAQNLTIIRNS